MVREIGAKNCGITIDYGHGAAAYDNLAESVAFVYKYGAKLMQLHMYDNYTLWDDDMIAGSIHTIPYLEMIYWLKKTGYSGWISTDQYPYREDGRDAVNESVRWMEAFIRETNRMDEQRVEKVIKGGNACEASAMLREIIFPQK